MRVGRGRRLVGLLTLLALLAIGVGITGFELPLPRGGSDSPTGAALPGVRAVASSALLKVGEGAPAAGELAFLAVEPTGNLLVSDSKRRTVMRFDASGQLLSEWGPVVDETRIGEPAGVAVWGDFVYVLDRGSSRILRMDDHARWQSLVDLGPLSTYGLNGLATDPVGNIYAADTGRNRILEFAPTGALLRQIGHAGNDLGGFAQPMALAFAPDGTFFVADWENGRIQRFDSSAVATEAWSTGFRSFGVGVDTAGRVFVPDTDHRRIEVYTPQGAPLGEIGTAGAPTNAIIPRQVALARTGQPSLYVLGTAGIARFDLANTPPPPQTVGTDVDVVSLAMIALVGGLLLAAVLSRRVRRARAALLPSPLDGPVWLQAENGAQRQQQQTRRDQDLLFAHQTERKQQPRHEHDETKRDAKANHHS